MRGLARAAHRVGLDGGCDEGLKIHAAAVRRAEQQLGEDDLVPRGAHLRKHVRLAAQNAERLEGSGRELVAMAALQHRRVLLPHPPVAPKLHELLGPLEHGLVLQEEVQEDEDVALGEHRPQAISLRARGQMRAEACVGAKQLAGLVEATVDEEAMHGVPVVGMLLGHEEGDEAIDGRRLADVELYPLHEGLRGVYVDLQEENFTEVHDAVRPLVALDGRSDGGCSRLVPRVPRGALLPAQVDHALADKGTVAPAVVHKLRRRHRAS